MNTTSPVQKTMTQPNGDVRDRILKVAVKLFAENGYTGTSVNQIVNLAGTTKPMLYYYFQNKEGLYRELILAFYKHVRQHLERIDALKGSTEQKLVAVVEANFDMVRKSPDLSWFGFVAYFSPAKDAPDVAVEELGEANFGVLQRIVDEGIRAGEVKGYSGEIALALSGLVMIYIMTHILKPKLDVIGPQKAEKLVHLLYEGIRVR